MVNIDYPPGTKAHFINLFSGTLQKDDKTWILDKPLYFYSAKLNKTIKPPAGSDTDGCSVPRLPFIYAFVGNRYHCSGALHDNLYKQAVYPRHICDELLYEALISEGCSLIRAEEFYLGVRAFGWQFYGDK